MVAKILVVEDEREIADLLVAYIERAEMQVLRATSVSEAIMIHGQNAPDLVLLDIGLPGGDGLDVLAAIRRRSGTPVIMLTAQGDDVSKLSSFRIGADDYVVKPFNPAEVIERIRAVLRRANGEREPKRLSCGPLSIDLEARLVSCVDGEHAHRRLNLTPTEFDILAHMARYPRRAFSRAELLEAAAPGSEAFDRVIDSHLSKLRQKLVSVGCKDIIEPVRGVGYRLWLGD
jgi:two-component system response regulator AdeR